MPSPAHRKPTKATGRPRSARKARAAAEAVSAGGFALPVSTAPMEARSATELPRDGAWQYEPKWDGFRCLAFKSGEEVDLRAKSGKPLGRFFPEVIALLHRLDARQFVLDGELVIEVEGRLSFDALQMRLHPAASRVEKLAQQTPARLILFDMLVDAKGAILTHKPLPARRAALEAFAAKNAVPDKLALSPFTRDRQEAERWLASWEAGATDGVVAKRRDGTYECGERAMVKVKRLKTADCVVGGFRYESNSDAVGSLLLGLYDSDGTLNHVGFTATISDKERPALTRRLEALREPPGFTGKAPGGPSRWSTERSGEWEPVRPELVVEVRFDHVSSRRFRHGTKLMRWRPDKDPRQCTYEQIEPR
ncbi:MULTISPECIES: ATP-dependent DNA ligase [Sinorhizobium]|uniref:ATP-dependent DNA ligase n=1 Tax=Sinorhizobium TaxID=28105 RepID=UPI000BEA7A1D|nr:MULTISPECIES: ATP-dependent DNA ligase [Sinorhizobium]PDT52808.1 ATP-dependent DNA ligase [Sinorhizobium sp. NG07B]POH28981.1 ATP-dependent DNA ligase [Sinorhizobium americanum]